MGKTSVNQYGKFLYIINTVHWAQFRYISKIISEQHSFVADKCGNIKA